MSITIALPGALQPYAGGSSEVTLAERCGKDMVLPMNSGGEGVGSGIKVARKWGTDLKGVPAGDGNIVVAHNNFHGRTTTIISFSDDETARRGFGQRKLCNGTDAREQARGDDPSLLPSSRWIRLDHHGTGSSSAGW
jgi:hypothetical protein